MIKILNKSFNVFLPLDKVEKSADEETYTIAGYGSTDALDLQGEQIDPSGIDADYLINDGFV